MKKAILILLVLCYCSEPPKMAVVEVQDDVCITQCARSSWTGTVRDEKVKICEQLYRGKKCCAIQFQDTGANMDMHWVKGEVGRVTGCAK